MKCPWAPRLGGCENEVKGKELCEDHKEALICEGNALAPRCEPPTSWPNFDAWVNHLELDHGVSPPPFRKAGECGKVKPPVKLVVDDAG